MTAFWILFGLNCIPFGLWNYAKLKKDQNLMTKIWINTAVSAASIDSGRWYTLITCGFAHQNIFHFGFNMFTAYTMCRLLSLTPISGPAVMVVTLGSIVCGSGFFVIHKNAQAANSTNRLVQHTAYATSAIGASGGVLGLAALATCFFPRFPIYIMFIPIPIPLWLYTIGYAVIDTYYLDKSTGTAHAGHIGGTLFGTLAYALVLRRLAPQHGVSGMLTRYFGRR